MLATAPRLKRYFNVMNATSTFVFACLQTVLRTPVSFVHTVSIETI